MYIGIGCILIHQKRWRGLWLLPTGFIRAFPHVYLTLSWDTHLKRCFFLFLAWLITVDGGTFHHSIDIWKADAASKMCVLFMEFLTKTVA